MAAFILLKTCFLRSLLLTATFRAILAGSFPVERQLALQNADVDATTLQPRNDHVQTSENGSIAIRSDVFHQHIFSNNKNADVAHTTGIRSPGKIAIGTSGDSKAIQTVADENQSSRGKIVNTIKNDRGGNVSIGDASHVAIGDILGSKQRKITQATTNDGVRPAVATENDTVDKKNQVVVRGSVNDAECPTTLNTSSKAKLNQRSECPWKYEIDRNPFRDPQVILQARPLCRRCIGQHSPDTRCETLNEWRTVHIQDGQGQMRRRNLLVNVGSVCTAITLAPG
ncbi:uncharacterized protein LOC135498851 [Lineus longissimus]|uniref:uncharacterized protein LOC135498851 n=1 Tax=Lineus longissimus TaxID=88925 RepID=UPI00315DF30B